MVYYFITKTCIYNSYEANFSMIQGQNGGRRMKVGRICCFNLSGKDNLSVLLVESEHRFVCHW